MTPQEFDQTILFILVDCYIANSTPAGLELLGLSDCQPMVASINETLESLTRDVQKVFKLSAAPKLSVFWPIVQHDSTHFDAVELTVENLMATLGLIKQSGGGFVKFRALCLNETGWDD